LESGTERKRHPTPDRPERPGSDVPACRPETIERLDRRQRDVRQFVIDRRQPRLYQEDVLQDPTPRCLTRLPADNETDYTEGDP
jgi:hypothetical protein